MVVDMNVAAATKRRWKHDETVAAFLDKAGVAWQYLKDVQIAQIDRRASFTNQARIGASLRQDVVDAYTLAMIDGDVFPGLVAYQRGDGAYVLMGGNHRLAAAQMAEINVVDIYLVQTSDPAIIHLLTTTLNGLVGWRPDTEEVIQQALFWVETYGRTVKAAAAEYRISPYKLLGKLRSRSTLKRLGRQSVAVSESSLERMSAIDNDNTLRSAVELIEEASLSGTHIDALVKDVREQRTEAGQEAVISQWRERDDIRRRIAEARRGIVQVHAKPVPKNRFYATVAGIQKLLERFPSPSALGAASPEELERVRDTATSLITALERWRDA